MVDTWSQPKVLKAVASVGRELPKPLDLQDRESKKAFKMQCPLCKYQSRNLMFCPFLFSRGLCLRYRPIINPGGQGCVLLNRCFTLRPWLLLFWPSHRPPFYLCSHLNPLQERVYYLCLPWEDASGCLVPRQAFTCGSSCVPLHCLFPTGPLSI